MRDESLYIVHAHVEDSEMGVINDGPLAALTDKNAALVLRERFAGTWFATEYHRAISMDQTHIGPVAEPMDFGWRRWGTFKPYVIPTYAKENDFRMRYWHRIIRTRVVEVPWLYEPAQTARLDVKFEGRELQLTYQV